MPGVKVISICRFISQTRERLSYFAHMDWHLSGLILEEVLNPDITIRLLPTDRKDDTGKMNDPEPHRIILQAVEKTRICPPCASQYQKQLPH